MPVMLHSDKGTAGGQVYINYDSLLNPVNVTAGNAYDMNFAWCNDSYPLFISWTSKDCKDQVAANGSVLAYLEFEVDANAQPKSFLNVSVASSAGGQSTRFCDETGYTFSAAYKSGSVFIN